MPQLVDNYSSVKEQSSKFFKLILEKDVCNVTIHHVESRLMLSLKSHLNTQLLNITIYLKIHFSSELLNFKLQSDI